MELKYYFTKETNGNVFLFSNNGQLLQSFNPNASVQKIDSTRLKITNEIGSDNGIILDYRKIDGGNSNPNIDITNLDTTIFSLCTLFFFINKTGNNQKIINFNFRNLGFNRALQPNIWHSNNLSQNINDIYGVDNVSFYPLPNHISNSIDNIPLFVPQFTTMNGIFKNADRERTYIKRIVIDVLTTNITALSSLSIAFLQHNIIYSPKADEYRIENFRIVRKIEIPKNISDFELRRFIYDFEKPSSRFSKEVFIEDALISLILKSSNNINPIVLKTLNIELELEKI